MPLDYGPGRLEHSIILHPDDFESMVDLIYAPGPFVEDAKARYIIDASSQSDDLRKLPWQFHKGYLTIVIEPLTVPTQSTIASLMRYSTIYPLFAAAVDYYFSEGGAPAAETMAVKQEKFKNQVVTAATPSTGKTFAGAYFAEFALDTNILMIKYITPPADSGTVRRYQNKITPVTNNWLAKTTTKFLHFDLVIPKGIKGGPTRHMNSALLRAQLAVDYICDPMVVQELVANHVHVAPSGGNKYFDASAPMVRTPLGNGNLATLSQTITSKGVVPDLTKPRIDPTVVIDSVEHDPEYPSSPDPNPVCAIINTIDPSTLSPQELAELKLKGYFQEPGGILKGGDDHRNKM